MAEVKEEKKGLTLFEMTLGFLLLLFFLSLLWYRFNGVLLYYQGADAPTLWHAFWLSLVSVLKPILEIVAVVFSGLAIWGIVVSYGKLMKIVKEEKEVYGVKSPVEMEIIPAMKNERWERVISHINSANSADWRLAIIEADVMLDDLLKTLGYHGESLGERLRAVEKSDMLTLDNAWEAHRVRNQVAHQGADYPLSEREAKRAVALYESVFKEFKII